MMTFRNLFSILVYLTLAGQFSAVKVHIQPNLTSIVIGNESMIKIYGIRIKNEHHELVQEPDFEVGNLEDCSNGLECKYSQIVDTSIGEIQLQTHHDNKNG